MLYFLASEEYIRRKVIKQSRRAYNQRKQKKKNNTNTNDEHEQADINKNTHRKFMF